MTVSRLPGCNCPCHGEPVGYCCPCWTVGAPSQEPREVLTLDAYRGQGDMDVSKVVAAGFEIAILKAGEGTSYFKNNPSAKVWVEKHAPVFAALNIPLQYYHFGRPDGAPRGKTHLQDAQLEAEDFLASIAPLPDPAVISYRSEATAAVFLDLEKDVDNLNESEGLAWTLRWIEVVEKQWPVGFYTGKGWLEDEVTPLGDDSLKKLFWREDNSRRALWVARYGQNTGADMRDKYPPSAKVPDFLGQADIEQFTSRRRTPGIDAPHDASYSIL